MPDKDDHESGAAVLDDVRDWLARYITVIDDADLEILALWIAHTWLPDEVRMSPRLLIDSPVPGSGKTTVLEHLQRLCREPIHMAVVTSAALLVRLLEHGPTTLLIDEAHNSLDPRKDGLTDTVAVINSGYKKGATRPVLVPGKGGDWHTKHMPTYAPVAMAGNNPPLKDDTRTRTIRVLLLPDLDGRAEESDWELIEPGAQILAERLKVWADSVREEIRNGGRPDLPAEITGRFREKWAPLKRIAVAAGGRWPAVADRLASADRRQWEADRIDGMVRDATHIVLLQHLIEVCKPGEDFVPSSDLIARLIEKYPEMWGPESAYGKQLTSQRLGRMLSTHFKINSIRPGGGGTPRGYRHRTFEAVWSRFRKPSPETGRTGQPVEPVAEDPDRFDHETGSTGSNGTPTGEGSALELDGFKPCIHCGKATRTTGPDGRPAHNRCTQRRTA